MSIQDIQWTTVTLLAAVFLALLAAIITANNGRKAWRELSGKQAREEQLQNVRDRLDDIEAKLSAHESRLNAGDKRFDEIAEDSAQTLTVLSGILMHTITGNGIDSLKHIKSDLDVYMATRRR